MSTKEVIRIRYITYRYTVIKMEEQTTRGNLGTVEWAEVHVTF